MAKSPLSFFSQMADHSQQQNTASSFALFSTPECIAWLTVFGMEAVAIVTLNALAIIVYLKERSLRKRSMYMVINQAVADIFVAGFVISQSSFLGNTCDFWTINFRGKPFYILTSVLAEVFPTASLINLGAISLERTHATFRPFKHRLIKKKIFGAAVAIVWIAAGLLSFSLCLFVFGTFNFQEYRIWAISYFSFFLFCLLIVVVSYSSMGIKIVCGTQPYHAGATSRERKLTKTLFIVTVVSLLLTLPIIIFRFRQIFAISPYTMMSPRTYYRLNYSFLFLLFANSLVNPVLYTFRMPEFRGALFSFFNCRFQPRSAQVFSLNEM